MEKQEQIKYILKECAKHEILTKKIYDEIYEIINNKNENEKPENKPS